MVDDVLNNQSQNAHVASPQVRRLKKIKRLVKRPLPRPLEPNNVPLTADSRHEKLSDNTSHQTVLSAQEVEVAKSVVTNTPQTELKQNNDAKKASSTTQNTQNTKALSSEDLLSAFDVPEPVFVNEVSESSSLEEEKSSSVLQTSSSGNDNISPDDPNFLNDDTDFSLPVTANAAENITTSRSPKFIEEQDITPQEEHLSFVQALKNSNMFTKKAITIFSVAALVVGLFMGKMLFGTSTVVRNGLSGVVANPEVPKGRARCGVAEKTQGCVLYLMNPQRQDLNARDFYDLASQLTGRQRFVIETGNMRYSNVKIAPGEIAQFNIPPLQ